MSTPVPAQRCLFARVPKGWYGEWHPTPHRQYYIQLSGELEIEVGDGERRRLGPGHVILLEDVDGRGHRSRVLGDTAVTGCFIQLPDGG